MTLYNIIISLSVLAYSLETQSKWCMARRALQCIIIHDTRSNSCRSTLFFLEPVSGMYGIHISERNRLVPDSRAYWNTVLLQARQ